MSNAAQEPRRWTLLVGRYEVYVVTGPPFVPADGSERVPVIEASAYDALLAERDALKAELTSALGSRNHLLGVVDAVNAATRKGDNESTALVVQRIVAELAALKIENDEADTLNTRLSRILTDTAHVLKGTPEALHSHSWADLAQVAAALKEKAERLHGIVAFDYDCCASNCVSVRKASGWTARHAPDCPAHPDFLTTSATESREAKGGTT